MFFAQRLDSLPNKKLEVRRLATELLGNPEELLVRHASALYALCHDKVRSHSPLPSCADWAQKQDFVIKQLAILSLAAIYADLMPSYRVQDWSELADAGNVKVRRGFVLFGAHEADKSARVFAGSALQRSAASAQVREELSGSLP
jgi:hypothetical protein